MPDFPIILDIALDFAQLRAADFAAFRTQFGCSPADADLSQIEWGAFWFSRLQQCGDTVAERYRNALDALTIPDAKRVHDETMKQVFSPDAGGFTGDSSESTSTVDASPES